DRPPLYVEAYVPMRDGGGGTSGVVEIYLDQTQTAQLFRASFATLAVGLAIVAALGFGLPTLAFLLRSRQASEAREQAEFLAHHDQLTGTLNRQSFAAALEAGRAQQPGVPLAVVLFNVDDFKAVND